MSYEYIVWYERIDGAEVREIFDNEDGDPLECAMRQYLGVCDPTISVQAAIIDDMGMTIEHWIAPCAAYSG